MNRQPGTIEKCCIGTARFQRASAGSGSIIVYYLIFGLCWIYFSDMLVVKLTSDPRLYSALSIAKGWLFIAVTAILLHVLIKRRICMLDQVQQENLNALEERERRVIHANRLYSVLSAVNRSIVRTTDQQELLNDICRILVTTGGFKMAGIGLPNDNDQVQFDATFGDEFNYFGSSRISVLDVPEGRGPVGTAIRERKPTLCNNIMSNPDMLPWREAAVRSGFSSLGCFPFTFPDGSVAGLAIYASEPDFFCEAEERLLCDVADDLGYALQMLSAARAHQVAERRLREVIDNSPAIIYAFDRDGYLFLANTAMAAMYGTTPEELIGRHRKDIGVSAESAQLHRENDLRVLEHGTAQVIEETNLQQDGMHTYLTIKFPLTSGTDSARGLVAGISTDITERKESEAELTRRNMEMEQFIYTVSHDLRSPLVTVKTFLGYLEEDLAAADDERVGKDIGFIHAAADRMEALLNELLDMSRVGREATPHERVAYRELVAEALSAVAGQLITAQVDVQINDVDLMLFGDRQRLLQIWQNLLDNAVKYMGSQPAPCITIGVEELPGDPVFYVCDNGIGIAPAYHEKVFGIFEQLDRRNSGVGMGLTMVRRIVELHGGHIQVESAGEGQGSCFRFTLTGACEKNRPDGL